MVFPTVCYVCTELHDDEKNMSKAMCEYNWKKHYFQNPHPCFGWMEGSARTGWGSEWMNNPETRAKKHDGLTDWVECRRERAHWGVLSSTRSSLFLTPQTSRPSSAPQQNRQLWNNSVRAGFAALAHSPFHLCRCRLLLSLPTKLFSPLWLHTGRDKYLLWTQFYGWCMVQVSCDKVCF